MAINYSSNWLKGSYDSDAFYFIGWMENRAAVGGRRLSVYYDGSIAIGAGYDLLQHVGQAQSDLAANGVHGNLTVDGPGKGVRIGFFPAVSDTCATGFMRPTGHIRHRTQDMNCRSLGSHITNRSSSKR